MYDRNTPISIRMEDGSSIKLEYHDTLPSTSVLAKKYAEADYPDKYVIFTEKQSTSNITGTKLSKGEFERGVFISCILRPSFFPSQAGLLGPLSALALIEALEEHTTKAIGLGWVSDIFCDGIRIGGCSFEGKLDSFSSYEYLIVSFAVKTDNKNFPPRLNDMIRQVFESQNVSVGMIIAKTVLNKFFAIYSDIKNPSKHMNSYKERFILLGKKIKYVVDGKKHNCRVSDVDTQTGALIVDVGKKQFLTITSPSGVIIPKKIKTDK